MDEVQTEQNTVTIEMPTEASSFVNTVADKLLVQPPANPQESVQSKEELKIIEEVNIQPIAQIMEPMPNAQRPCSYCQRKDEIEAVTYKYLEQSRGSKGQVPFLEEIADMLDVDTDTITNWANKTIPDGSLEHPRFFGACKSIKNRQKLQLLKRTLGRFNPTGAIFQLKVNHGCIETEKQVHAMDSNEPVRIEIIEERALPDGK